MVKRLNEFPSFLQSMLFLLRYSHLLLLVHRKWGSLKTLSEGFIPDKLGELSRLYQII